MPTTYFSEDHEWIDVDGDIGTVGITYRTEKSVSCANTPGAGGAPRC